jgi:hypothetical protein
MLNKLEGRSATVCLFQQSLSFSQTCPDIFNSVDMRHVQYKMFSASAVHDMTKRSFADIKRVSCD